MFGGDCTLTLSRAGVAAEDVADGTHCGPGHPPTVCVPVVPSEDGVAASSGEKIPDIPGRGKQEIGYSIIRREGGWTKGQRKGG